MVEAHPTETAKIIKHMHGRGEEIPKSVRRLAEVQAKRVKTEGREPGQRGREIDAGLKPGKGREVDPSIKPGHRGRDVETGRFEGKGIKDLPPKLQAKLEGIRKGQDANLTKA